MNPILKSHQSIFKMENVLITDKISSLIQRKKDLNKQTDAIVLELEELVGKLMEENIKLREEKKILLKALSISNEEKAPDVPIVLEVKKKTPLGPDAKEKPPMVTLRGENLRETTFKTIDPHRIPEMSNHEIKESLRFTQTKRSHVKDRNDEKSRREVEIRNIEEQLLTEERHHRKSAGQWA